MAEFNNYNTVLLEVVEQAAIAAAVAASKAVMAYWPSPTNASYDHNKVMKIVNKKSGIGNFATVADLASGDAIREVISRYPALAEIGFETEETETGPSKMARSFWNIDEIDGTANFSRGSDHFGISIGEHGLDGTPEIGVIAFPARGVMIVARRGMSAKLFDFFGKEMVDLRAYATRLPVSPASNELFVAYDLGYNKKASQIQDGAVRLADQVSALKSYHSSSYTLGEIALGTIDAFFTRYPTIYDIGASSVVIEAIGGKVSDMDGNPIDWNAPERTYLAARTPEIHNIVLKMLKSK